MEISKIGNRYQEGEVIWFTPPSWCSICGVCV